MPKRTRNGKVFVWNADTGERAERFSVDAREMVETGAWSFDPPDGVESSEEGSSHALHEVSIKDLPRALQDVDDVEELRAAAQSERRSTAFPHYETRIRELLKSSPHPSDVEQPREPEAEED